jgi:hypothetical protein
MEHLRLGLLETFFWKQNKFFRLSLESLFESFLEFCNSLSSDLLFSTTILFSNFKESTKACDSNNLVTKDSFFMLNMHV